MEYELADGLSESCAAADYLIRFDGVTLRVAGEDRFRNTQWSIRPNEHWVIAGPTGSGKTTLLQAVLGHIPVSKGEILYRLGDAAEPAEEDYPEGAIGHVSQGTHRTLIRSVLAFHAARWTSLDDKPPLLVRDVITNGKRGLGGERLQEVLEALRLDHLLTRGLETLSNGEVRKTILARALASEPKVLLLDDPYEGLDTASRRNLKKLLDWVMRRGTSVVMTVQRPEEIPRGITHILCVERNRTVASGPKRTVRNTRVFGRWLAPPRCDADFSRVAAFRRGQPFQADAGPLVEIRNASVTYDGVAILRDVNWTIRPGEKWVLRGPNGSGKSTLASLILGDNPQAYSNHVRVFGWLRGHGESVWEIKERIGWIAPELHYHYDEMATCREVVCSGLYDTIGVYQDGSAREDRQVRRWMRALRVERFADEYFGALSDGQQRLVLMARALVKEAPLLILDEPCQGLDPAHRSTMYKLLDSLARQSPTTVIYITHHTDEIPSSFTNALFLNGGRVTRCGKRRRATRG